MITVERKVRLRQGRGRLKGREKSEGGETGAGRVPRVARLMALAIRFDQLLREGVVKDQAELARLGHVSRARLTQILNLLNLAPEIQESILFLPAAGRQCGATTEKHLRPLVRLPNWSKQRRARSRFFGRSCD
ncbi:MAG: hypothetical protein U0795_27175 [Pirellulales bacterium]